MPGISSLRIPRKFGLRGLPLRGRLALVGFRTLVLANTVFVSVVWGSMGFWGLEPGFSFGQAWPPPLEYWIVIAVAFGSVPLLLAYTLVRDLKARGVRTSSQRMKAVFLDELGVVPEYTLSPWTKRLAFLSFIGTIIGVVSGFYIPLGGDGTGNPYVRSTTITLYPVVKAVRARQHRTDSIADSAARFWVSG